MINVQLIEGDLMKTVTDKYLEMNHNFIELHNSIVQKVKDEKPINYTLEGKVHLAMAVLNDFLTFYKKENNINTNIIEEDKDKDKDLTVDDLEIIEV